MFCLGTFGVIIGPEVVVLLAGEDMANVEQQKMLLSW